MRRVNLLFFLLVFCCFSVSFSQNFEHPGDINSGSNKNRDTRVYYSVFVQSFYDSNEDGIGDIPGLIQKLDYLKDLGIGGLWLLPFHPSPSYHKYDVSDYYGVHPDYGTLDDYRTLVNEAHKRDIKVLLDLVVNHTSFLHPWFKESGSGSENEYRDYYIWESDSIVWAQEKSHWHQVRDKNGNKLEGERYYGFFGNEMPDLNFDNNKVREEIIKIGNYWIKEIGIDGFRLDAMQHIYSDEQLDKTLQWWKKFGKAMRKTKKDVFIVGEAWGEDSIIAPFLDNGISAAFNFKLAEVIRKSVLEGKNLNVIDECNKISNLYRDNNPDFEDAIFLSNHDMNRIMSELKGDINKAKIAAALLLTLPGNPFIYYGEEIGMFGEKPDPHIREPFLWNVDKRNKGQTHWETPIFSSPETVKPLYYQKDYDNSLYEHYKKLIHVRNQSKALRQGDLYSYNTDNKHVIAFYRMIEDEYIFVIINLLDDYQVIDSPQNISQFQTVFSTHSVFKANGNQITLQGNSIFILKTSNNLNN
ncbi:alpha-amylase family glycosyl hydrolase [Bacteroidota bacterium]